MFNLPFIDGKYYQKMVENTIIMAVFTIKMVGYSITNNFFLTIMFVG